LNIKMGFKCTPEGAVTVHTCKGIGGLRSRSSLGS